MWKQRLVLVAILTALTLSDAVTTAFAQYHQYGGGHGGGWRIGLRGGSGAQGDKSPIELGCRFKVGREMGIARGTGHQHPEFWERVGRCMRSQGQTPKSATRAATETAPSKKIRKREKPDRPTKQFASKPPAEKSIETRPVATSTPAPILIPALTSPQMVALPRPPVIPEFGRRVALVIGNGIYGHVPALPNATNDAQAIAKTLEATGFQSVTLKTNLTREQTLSALSDFAKLADTADWAAIYYSGHGIESRGVNYIVPIDATLKVDRDIDFETVDVAKALSAIEGAKKLKLLILDACRHNPFLDQMKRTVATRSISRGLARMEPETGLLIVYAAKDGEVALDGDGKHSPFAAALMQRMLTPNLEIRRLFDLVRDDVLASTQKRQMPFSYGSLSGNEDFYFETN